MQVWCGVECCSKRAAGQHGQHASSSTAWQSAAAGGSTARWQREAPATAAGHRALTRNSAASCSRGVPCHLACSVTLAPLGSRRPLPAAAAAAGPASPTTAAASATSSDAAAAGSLLRSAGAIAAIPSPAPGHNRAVRPPSAAGQASSLVSADRRLQGGSRQYWLNDRLDLLCKLVVGALIGSLCSTCVQGHVLRYTFERYTRGNAARAIARVYQTDLPARRPGSSSQHVGEHRCIAC